MNSEGKQYSLHQMDLLTHSNANTGTLCLNLEYPWSHQRKRFQIFSLFHLRSGRCGSGRRRGGSPPGRTAACSSCRCGARARPRPHHWPPSPGDDRAGLTGRRERGEVGPAAAALVRAARPWVGVGAWSDRESILGSKHSIPNIQQLARHHHQYKRQLYHKGLSNENPQYI